MGIGASHQTKLEQEFGGIGEDDERYFGLENFGNTCYCNSVLQALYFCEPLRQHLAELREESAPQSSRGSGSTSMRTSLSGAGSGTNKSQENSVLSQLAELFALISKQKRRSGSLAPTDFLRTLRERNELFRGNMQQDAHEFFNFVLNEMADSLVARRKMQVAKQQVQQPEREKSQEGGQDEDGHLPNHQQQQQRHQSQYKHHQFQQDKRHHHHHHHSQNNASHDQHEPNSHRQANQPQSHHQQHPDPRRSTRAKTMMGLKAGFGNGSKNGLASGTDPPAPTAAGASTPAGGTEERGRGTSDERGARGGAGDGNPALSGISDAWTSKQAQPGVALAGSQGADRSGEGSAETWVHRIFQGVLTNQTKCLCCETVSNRDEPFMDLSLDVEQNSSVTACLKSFSSTETLTKKNKFFCENCNALQEAEKKIELKRLPRVLTLHLKRFKYVESLDSFSKLSHRVVFPLELRAPNVMEGPAETDADARLYRLFAVVVHIGRGPNHGHYVTVVKSGGRWILFDDDVVEQVSEQVLKRCFGLSRPATGATNTGYLLFYDCGEDSGGRPSF